MKSVLQYLNMLSLIIAVFVNYYVNAKKAGAPSISEISSRYPTLLTPAGYAFGIWGLIYINTGIHGYRNRATAPFARRIKQIEEH